MPKKVHVEDPISISIHHLASPKRTFVVIGEIHDRWMKKGCPSSVKALTLMEFFQSLAKKLPTVDFFIERPLPLTKNEPLHKNPWLHWFYKLRFWRSFHHGLLVLHEELGTCLPKLEDESRCPLPTTARVHFIDFRELEKWSGWKYDDAVKSSESNLEDIRMFMGNIEAASVFSQDSRIVYHKADEFVTLCEILFERHGALWDVLLKAFKIEKQLEGIRSSLVRKKLRHHMKIKWNQIWVNIGQYVKMFRDHPYTIRDQYLPGDIMDSPLCSNIANQFLEASCIPIDLYMMARALRNFVDGTHATNVVTYVGDAHADNYREMLHILGAKEILLEYSREGAACLPVEKALRLL
jgi:hypothetical protein